MLSAVNALRLLEFDPKEPEVFVTVVVVIVPELLFELVSPPPPPPQAASKKPSGDAEKVTFDLKFVLMKVLFFNFLPLKKFRPTERSHDEIISKMFSM